MNNDQQCFCVLLVEGGKGWYHRGNSDYPVVGWGGREEVRNNNGLFSFCRGKDQGVGDVEQLYHINRQKQRERQRCLDVPDTKMKNSKFAKKKLCRKTF